MKKLNNEFYTNSFVRILLKIRIIYLNKIIFEARSFQSTLLILPFPKIFQSISNFFYPNPSKLFLSLLMLIENYRSL